MISRQTLMPFGKYKDAPLFEILNDRRYVLWVLSLRKIENDYPELHAFLRKEAVELLVYWSEEKEKAPFAR